MIFCFIVFLNTLNVSNQHFVFAQNANNTTYTLLEPLPCIPTETSPCPEGPGELKTEVNLNEYLIYAINLLIALSAVAAVFMITWGGFQYMTTDSWQNKKEGLTKFKNAIFGLLLVLCSYIILRTVNPRLVEIPATLVPPLTNVNLKDSISPDDFFDQISAEVQRLSNNLDVSIMEEKLRQAKGDVKLEKQNIDDLKKQLDILSKEGINETDPRVQIIKTSIEVANNNIKEKEANVLVEGIKFTNNASIELAAQGLVGKKDFEGINTTINYYKKRIENSENIKIFELEKLGKYEKYSVVNDQAIYSQTILDLMRSDAMVQNADFGFFFPSGTYTYRSQKPQALAELNTVPKQIESIKDPILKQELQDRLKNSIALIEEKFK